MTIDIRAKIISSAGEVISGEVSDSYLPDAGLVFTTGSIILSGVRNLAIGTIIEISYIDIDKRRAARIPRQLRVLSSFADPLRNQTTLELGCTLTYFQDRKPLPLEQPLKEPEYDCEESYRIPPRIGASTVFSNCCLALGLAYSGNPLTNSFITDSFDYSAGYVAIIGDLLKSEGYFGHIDARGVLQVVSFNSSGGKGPVLDETNIIDISSTSSSDIPGDAVIVSYNSIQLNPPDPEKEKEENGSEYMYKRNWELDESYPDPVIVYDEWTDSEGNQVRDEYKLVAWTTSRTVYDVWDRAMYRFEVQNGLIAQTWKSTWWTYELEAGSSYAPDRESGSGSAWWDKSLSPGEGTPREFYSGRNFAKLIGQNAGPDDLCLEDEGDDKPENYANVLVEEQWESGPLADIVQACGFSETWYPNIKSLPIERTTKLRQFTYYEKDEDTGITKTRTDKYIPYVQTPEGAYSIGKRAEVVGQFDSSVNPFEDSVLRIIDDASTIVKYGGDTKIRTEREFGLQKRPSRLERTVQTYSRQAPIASQGEIVYAFGNSSTSRSAVEFQMPYASDDSISGSQRTGYSSIASNAGQKAVNYGRLQNRLLIGSNRGVSLQMMASDMPSYPFEPINISLRGYVGQYRTNAQSWTFDSQGIIASCDALFWGAVGKE
jgi:hypothetical protein